MSSGGGEIRELFDTSVPVVTLGREPDGLAHTSLAVARSAGRLGIPAYGVHEDRWAPVALSRHSRGGILHPGSASEDDWVQNLCRLGRRLGERPVLVPIDDADVFFLERHQETLAEAFRFPRQPAGLAHRTADKRAMSALCAEIGIPTPGAAFPEDEAAARAGGRALGFPVVLKRIDSSLSGREESPRVLMASDETALLAAYRRMESDVRPNVMLQEYIPGGSESVWMMNGYFGRESECLVAFTGRKLRQYPPGRGFTTLGVCVRNDAVERATRDLAAKIGYRGIIDIGWRFDARDGEYKLLDLNPRLGATFRLFVGGNGMDVLRAMHLDLTGRPVPASRPVEGRRWVTEIHDLLTSSIRMRRGDLSPGQWARSLSGVAEAAWLAADDPLPAAAVAVRAAGRRLRGGGRAAAADAAQDPRVAAEVVGRE